MQSADGQVLERLKKKVQQTRRKEKTTMSFVRRLNKFVASGRELAEKLPAVMQQRRDALSAGPAVLDLLDAL